MSFVGQNRNLSVGLVGSNLGWEIKRGQIPRLKGLDQKGNMVGSSPE